MRKKTFLFIVSFLLLILTIEGCDLIKLINPKKRSKAKKKTSAPASLKNNKKDLELAKTLILKQVKKMDFDRNFFRPLIGRGSLKEELARKALENGENDEDGGDPVLVTPKNMKLVLKGVLLSDKKIAYVGSPEEIYVLYEGDSLSTMKVLEISPDQVVFLLEDGEISILSNN